MLPAPRLVERVGDIFHGYPQLEGGHCPPLQPVHRNNLNPIYRSILQRIDKHFIRPTAMQPVGNMMGELERRDGSFGEICRIENDHSR